MKNPIFLLTNINIYKSFIFILIMLKYIHNNKICFIKNVNLYTPTNEPPQGYNKY